MGFNCDKLRVSVVVPVYRNGGTIAELCGRVMESLGKNCEVEVILVVDGVREDAQVARQVAERDGRVKVIELAKNVGQHRAVMVGFVYARGEVGVVMDADLQDRPEDLGKLVEAVGQENVEVAYALRTNRFSSASRWLSSRIFKCSMWCMTLGRLPARAGMFLAMRQPVYAELAKRTEWDEYVPGLLARRKVRFAGVEVVRDRSAESGYTMRARWRLARRALRTYYGRARRVGPVEILCMMNVEGVDVVAC